MIVNKSMYPLQTGFGVISKMQDKFATLQMQLGTGEKASKLSEMARDLPMSLSVRTRLGKIEGFSGNIDTVNLRLSFLDNAMSRFDKIEGEARISATQGQYGTNNINMATLPGLSQARLDEVITMLNLDVAGRYMFGGAKTGSAPLPTTDVLLNGQNGKAGFKTVVSERQAADAGTSGLGRLVTAIGTPDDNKVTITEDGIHPFGLKLSNVSKTAPDTAVQWSSGPSPVAADPADQLGDTGSITFDPDPAKQIKPGEAITLGFTLPDGQDTQIVLTAIAAEDGPPSPGQFVVSNDPAANAASFKAALDIKLTQTVGGALAAASTFAAAENFFNKAGEPVLRVAGGNPAQATALRVATDADTIQWYSGESSPVSAEGKGRLDISSTGDQVTLARRTPLSDSHGFQIAGVSGPASGVTISPNPASNADSVALTFTAAPAVGDTVEIILSEPPKGATRTISLKAVAHDRPGPGEFTIGATPEATATNFGNALDRSVTEAARAAEGYPRQSITAQVDDNTRVSYGMQANESGFLSLMRTLSAMAVTTYPDGEDSVTREKFDAMADRQQAAMSEARNVEPGSIEIITMELGVARNSLDNATKRHTDYKAQLDNLLSDIETVSKEDVAMEILALQTRLQASYQTTSMVSQLSLVNFI